MFKYLNKEKNLFRLFRFENSINKKIFFIIILVSLFLRLPGVFWGIPVFDPMVQNYHPDEPKIISGAYNFPFHILKNTDLRYPTFYHYFIGGLSFPIRILFKINDWPFENYKIFVAIFGRIISIILGLGSILLTFLLGKKLYNEKVGLLGALFASLSLYHVQNSSWATLDIPNSFFLILTVLIAFNMYEKRTMKSYILTGISFGILVGTKYIGAFILISILILHIYEKDGTYNFSIISKKFLSRNLWLLIITAALVFLITTPGAVIKPKTFVHSLFALFFRDAGRSYNDFFSFTTLKLDFRNYSIATDPFLTTIMLCGLLLPIKKRIDKEIPLLVIILIFLLLFGSLASRQMIAILPLTSILGAHAIWILYTKLKFVSKPVWITIFSLWIIFALVYNSLGILFRMNDTRTEAAYFIKNNLTKGSSVGASTIGNYKRWDWMFPKIDKSNYKIIDALDRPDFVILTSYDFEKMEEALKSDKLQNYKWDSNYSYKWYRGQSPNKEVFEFYDELLNNKSKKYNYKLIKNFEKHSFVSIEFPPPNLRIYQRLSK